MAKCCFCGLCTTVCPTECLVMTPEYDVPVLDLSKLNFGFGNLSEEEAEAKRREWEEEKARKEAAKTTPAQAEKQNSPARPMRPGSSPASADSPAGADTPPAPAPARPRPSAFPRPSKPSASGDESN
jgi:Na+-translocating ferredoxin:NAD+ oxidoreductase RnfC subunit